MNALFWIAAALLATVAGVLYVRRLRRLTRGPALTDAMIARIEALGEVDVEEPLDLEEAAAEEERFWEDEPWDEPEEF
jgi:hypothetical protein